MKGVFDQISLSFLNSIGTPVLSVNVLPCCQSGSDQFLAIIFKQVDSESPVVFFGTCSCLEMHCVAMASKRRVKNVTVAPQRYSTAYKQLFGSKIAVSIYLCGVVLGVMVGLKKSWQPMAATDIWLSELNLSSMLSE